MALAQKFDVAAGISSIDAPGSAVANNINHQPLSLTGGAYLSFSGDYIFHKNIGVEGEFVRRQTEGYDDAIDLDYRPIFYDANAIWRKDSTSAFPPSWKAVWAWRPRAFTREAAEAPTATSTKTISWATPAPV